MANTMQIVKQQLQAMKEIKERVDKYGDLLSPEDREYLAEKVDESYKKCKLYVEMEEKVEAAEKAKKVQPAADKPAVTEEKPAEEKPKKKPAKKKKDTAAEQPALLQEETAPAPEEVKKAEPVPEEKPAEAAEEPGAKTWEPMAEEAAAVPAEEEMDLDDLLG